MTILDTTNRSLDLDDMLKHPPLYHRSRVGFSLPMTTTDSEHLDDWDGNGGILPPGRVDAATPPLEFIDPRSAAFSSSQVSLSSFIAKGRLRIIRGDARNATLVRAMLNPHLAMGAEAGRTIKQDKHESKSGFHNKPHHDEDVLGHLPPISGIFHLAGYENGLCRLRPRDCADMERQSVAVLASALERTSENVRPWIVLADRGNLDNGKVKAWLKEDTIDTSKEKEGDPIMDEQTKLPQQGSTTAMGNVLVDRSHTPKRTRRQLQKGPIAAAAYAAPLETFARERKLHAISLRLPPDNHVFGDSFASRTESPVANLVHSAIGHLPILIDDDTFPNMQIAKEYVNLSDAEPMAASGKSIWQTTGLVYMDDVIESFLAAGELLARSNTVEYLRRVSIIAEVAIIPPQASSGGSSITAGQSDSSAQEVVDWIIQLTKSSSPVGITREATSLFENIALIGNPLDRGVAKRLLGTAPSTPLPLALKPYIRSLLGRQTTYLDNQMAIACAPPPDLRTLNDALAELHMCDVQILGLVSAENIVLACNPDYLADHSKPPLVLRDAVPYTEGLSQVKLRSRWGPVGKVEVGFFCPFGPNGEDERIYWTESTKEIIGKWASASEQARMAAEDPTLWTYDRFEVNFVRRDTRSFTLSVPQYPQANAESPKRRMVFTVDHSKKGSEGGMKEMILLNWQLLAETGPDWQTMEWRLNPITCNDRQPKTVRGFSFMREDRKLEFQHNLCLLTGTLSGLSTVHLSDLVPIGGRLHYRCRLNIRDSTVS